MKPADVRSAAIAPLLMLAFVGSSGTRHLFVWQTATLWIVAIEQGGIVYGDSIFAYRLSEDGRTASLIATREISPVEVCTTAIELARS